MVRLAMVLVLTVISNFTLISLGQSQTKTIEIDNGQELTKKKIAEDKVTNEKFQLWKVELPKQQQVWEEVLEKNLGSFYLPIYQREKLSNKVSAWDYVKDDSKLPRVLLIGDSVSRGYTLEVRKALLGKANVHRAPENCGPTANGLKKIKVWLGEEKWDVIHFNFGIHDRKTAEKDYETRLEQIVKELKATGAKIIWASTTPIPSDIKDGPEAATAIVKKNKIALDLMKKNNVYVNDLYEFITPMIMKVQNPKDVHFNAGGYEVLGQQVALEIEKVLKVK